MPAEIMKLIGFAGGSGVLVACATYLVSKWWDRQETSAQVEERVKEFYAGTLEHQSSEIQQLQTDVRGLRKEVRSQSRLIHRLYTIITEVARRWPQTSAFIEEQLEKLDSKL